MTLTRSALNTPLLSLDDVVRALDEVLRSAERTEAVPHVNQLDRGQDEGLSLGEESLRLLHGKLLGRKALAPNFLLPFRHIP